MTATTPGEDLDKIVAAEAIRPTCPVTMVAKVVAEAP